MIFKLSKQIIFPDPELAEEDGLLAIGGDLTPERLLTAYSSGIFPWFSQGDPILWWSPNPRTILLPNKLKISKSLLQSVKNKGFEVKFNTNFKKVMELCANTKRDNQDGTWILQKMINAYTKLYKLGYAHSIEVYKNNNLVGGLYGVSLGKAFFGESMFHTERDASKVALYSLCQKLIAKNFHFIDAQVRTEHLISMGAEEIPRINYLNYLNKALEK